MLRRFVVQTLISLTFTKSRILSGLRSRDTELPTLRIPNLEFEILQRLMANDFGKISGSRIISFANVVSGKCLFMACITASTKEQLKFTTSAHYRLRADVQLSALANDCVIVLNEA